MSNMSSGTIFFERWRNTAQEYSGTIFRWILSWIKSRNTWSRCLFVCKLFDASINRIRQCYGIRQCIGLNTIKKIKKINVLNISIIRSDTNLNGIHLINTPVYQLNKCVHFPSYTHAVHALLSGAIHARDIHLEFSSQTPCSRWCSNPSQCLERWFCWYLKFG